MTIPRLLAGLMLLAWLTGCSSTVLKKRVGELPEDYMHCPNTVQGDFVMCKPAKHVYRVVDPQ